MNHSEIIIIRNIHIAKNPEFPTNPKNTIKHVFYTMIHCRLKAQFTIEAAVIIPITFVIMAWFITQAFDIHNRTVYYANSVNRIIESSVNSSFEHVSASNGADTAKTDTSLGIIGAFSDSHKDYSNVINTENLDGRKVLLKYKLAKEGVKKLTGGLSDED